MQSKNRHGDGLRLGNLDNRKKERLRAATIMARYMVLVEGEDLYNALGRNKRGRYLSLFFIRKLDNKALIITARDMKKGKYKDYIRSK